MKCLNKTCKAFDIMETNNCANMYDISECSVRDLTDPKECEWTTMGLHKDYFVASCEKDTAYPDLKFDKMKYCPYCGKTIKVKE